MDSGRVELMKRYEMRDPTHHARPWMYVYRVTDVNKKIIKLKEKLDISDQIIIDQGATLKLFNTGTFKDITDIQANAIWEMAGKLILVPPDGGAETHIIYCI